MTSFSPEAKARRMTERLLKARNRLRAIERKRLNARLEYDEYVRKKRDRTLRKSLAFYEWWNDLVEQFRALPLNDNGYHAVSTARFSQNVKSARLPSTSGVYFFWNGETVEYVGRAENLRIRVASYHHSLKPYHEISFIPMDKKELDFAEAYYIGTLRPVLNFCGKRNGFNGGLYDQPSRSGIIASR